MNKILLVEDDEMIGSGLVYAFEQDGYSVTHNKSINEAKKTLQTYKFDLAILDLQLPDGTGFELSKTLRDTDTAMIFLTVTDDEGNIVRAFDEGADDYVTKPFRLRELLARVKRSLNARNHSSLLTLGSVTIDPAAGKAFINDQGLFLTALEYRLLLTFAVNRGQMLTRTQILESIWDSAGNFVEDNTLTVYIKRLREKLGDAVKIETIRGGGYRVD